MFGRQRFLLTSPPPSGPVFPHPGPVLPGPPLPPGWDGRSISVFFFEPVADENGVWLCGPYTDDRIQGGQGARGKPWAIWVHPAGNERRVFIVGKDSSPFGGGRLLNNGQLELLFTTNVSPDLVPPERRQVEALHLRTIDVVAGVVHQDTFNAPSISKISSVEFPFRDFSNLYAATNSPRDGYELRQIIDRSWASTWTAPTLQPPPGWEPGFFSAPQMACPPTLSTDGAWVMAFFTRYQSSNATKTRKVAAVCSIRGLQTSWSIVLGDPYSDVESVSVDVDYNDEIYAALVLRSSRGLSQVITHKLDSSGSLLPGWPRQLTSAEGLRNAKIKVGARDVFVAGVTGGSFATSRPFVASYKRDGTPTNLFGRDFRSDEREEWHVCGLAVLNEDFFLTGYTIMLDPSAPSDPDKQVHALQVAKFDRYGVLI